MEDNTDTCSGMQLSDIGSEDITRTKQPYKWKIVHTVVVTQISIIPYYEPKTEISERITEVRPFLMKEHRTNGSKLANVAKLGR